MTIHLVCPNPAVDRTLLIDDIQINIPNRPNEVMDSPGGKSFNVVHALTTESLNQPYVVHTILGGENGDRVKRLAKERRIDLMITEIDSNTRECHILVDTKNETIIPVYEKGFQLDSKTLDHFTQRLVDAIHSDDIVVFSGSLMKGMPTNYINFVQQAVADDSVKFIVDTSGAPLKSVVQEGKPYLIKINDEEYNELFSTQLNTMSEFLTHMNQHLESFDNFIITLGSKGLVAKYQEAFYTIRTPHLVAKNPVASGDFLLAGLVRGIVLDQSFESMIKRGVAYATDNVTHWFPHIEVERLDEWEQQIKIEKV